MPLTRVPVIPSLSDQVGVATSLRLLPLCNTQKTTHSNHVTERQVTRSLTSTAVMVSDIRQPRGHVAVPLLSLTQYRRPSCLAVQSQIWQSVFVKALSLRHGVTWAIKLTTQWLIQVSHSASASSQAEDKSGRTEMEEGRAQKRRKETVSGESVLSEESSSLLNRGKGGEKGEKNKQEKQRWPFLGRPAGFPCLWSCCTLYLWAIIHECTQDGPPGEDDSAGQPALSRISRLKCTGGRETPYTALTVRRQRPLINRLQHGPRSRLL